MNMNERLSPKIISVCKSVLIYFKKSQICFCNDCTIITTYGQQHKEQVEDYQSTWNQCVFYCVCDNIMIYSNSKGFPSATKTSITQQSIVALMICYCNENKHCQLFKAILFCQLPSHAVGLCAGADYNEHRHYTQNKLESL